MNSLSKFGPFHVLKFFGQWKMNILKQPIRVAFTVAKNVSNLYICCKTVFRRILANFFISKWNPMTKSGPQPHVGNYGKSKIKNLMWQTRASSIKLITHSWFHNWIWHQSLRKNMNVWRLKFLKSPYIYGEEARIIDGDRAARTKKLISFHIKLQTEKKCKVLKQLILKGCRLSRLAMPSAAAGEKGSVMECACEFIFDALGRRFATLLRCADVVHGGVELMARSHVASWHVNSSFIKIETSVEVGTNEICHRERKLHAYARNAPQV